MSIVSRSTRKIITEGISLLRQKPVRLHGINPTLRYGEKEIPLPRFCTEEMKTAVQMNKNVIKSTKTAAKRTYPKASAQDLKRLTSETIEDSYTRVEWTNPKDGKIYNILKQGEREDGKISVRILDSEGAFIKEAELTPKTIGIPDDYDTLDCCSGLGLTHGEMTSLFAKRYNPFAKYVPFKISLNKLQEKNELEKVFSYLDSGGHLDYLSCSYGTSNYGTKKIRAIGRNMEEILNESRDYDRLAQRGPRILIAAGNAKPTQIEEVSNLSDRVLMLNKKVEGVGSLNPKTGKISKFSLSRNSELTQHYEIGEYTPTITPHGVNITGLPGTDLPPTVITSGKILENMNNPLLGQSTEKLARIKKAIDDRLKELQQASRKLFERKLPFNELKTEMDKIEKVKFIYNQRRIKLLNYSFNIVERDGKMYLAPFEALSGTSISTPIRTAKLALNDMLEGIL